MVAGSLGVISLWLSQRTRPGAVVRVRTTLLRHQRRSVSLACSRYGSPTRSRWYHSFLFNRSHSGVLTERLWEVSYIRPDAPWKEIPFQVAEFVQVLLAGSEFDSLAYDRRSAHWRHHVEGSGGAMLLPPSFWQWLGFCWSLLRWRDPWWRFVLYGLAVSIVPGAITDWPFHELRLMGYAVFLLVLQSRRWNGCLHRLNQSSA